MLSQTFKRSMRQALTGGYVSVSRACDFYSCQISCTSASSGKPPKPEDHRTPQTVATLDAYAVERWETILHYMVSSGTSAPVRQPSLGVLHLLTEGRLMSSGTGKYAPGVPFPHFRISLIT